MALHARKSVLCYKTTECMMIGWLTGCISRTEMGNNWRQVCQFSQPARPCLAGPIHSSVLLLFPGQRLNACRQPRLSSHTYCKPLLLQWIHYNMTEFHFVCTCSLQTWSDMQILMIGLFILSTFRPNTSTVLRELNTCSFENYTVRTNTMIAKLKDS